MTRSRSTPRDARDLLRAHGLSPKRAFSQNFLVQPIVIAQIADATVALGSAVVELGPGLGALTEALLERGATVIAVELDRDMVRVLEAELGGRGDLRIVTGDAADTDFVVHSKTLGSKLVVAGNLPYHATGAILRHVVHHKRVLHGAVLMVQREVRDRLVASPGTKDYGALSVFVQAGFEIDTICRLRPGSFFPAPNVESAVVRLVPRTSPLAEETSSFRAIVRAAFQQRRKTLRNALRPLGADARVVEAALHAEVDLARRGETLAVADFARLAEAWDALGGR